MDDWALFTTILITLVVAAWGVDAALTGM